ncbi:MAG: 16S rRNA (cytosine(967)-C(5))-methyltransferase RsmB [Bacteroidetes bacterium]|nr:16S rRNA (cytosine(967)-C(5))-methyltransferase RsmB [Bacteroidota bacterium]
MEPVENGTNEKTVLPESPEERQTFYPYLGPRGTAIKILNRFERSDAYLDKLLDIEMRQEEMNDLDKALMNEIVTGVVRWRMKLDWVLTGFFHGNFTKAETNIKNALRVALYQIMFLDRVPHSAAVNEAVEFIKRLRGQKVADLVNAVLRTIIRNIDGIRYPEREENPIRHLAVVESHPLWITKRWIERFGFDEAQQLMKANNTIPPVSLRFNKLKGDIKILVEYLNQHKFEYNISKYVPNYIRVQHMAAIGKSDLFNQGYFTVQDESAALPVLLLNPQPGERVIDLCAAPGGKTTFIGELMGNVGEIVAVDRYENRLQLVSTACKRLGIHNVILLATDARTVELPVADKVLVDAPCSGLGVIAKKPDAKWLREAEDIPKLVELQKAILENAAKLVKSKGILVYSTCTIEPEENAGVIEDFLSRHPEFSVESAAIFVHPALVNASGYIETLPHKHGMDGSFAVRLRRK